MRITRETDYGIRCVLYLASRTNGAVAEEISETQGIPKAFTPKVMQKLKKAGIVRSTRGVKGRYFLAKRPEEITLYDVVEVLNGPLGLNICVVDRKSCDRVDKCSVHPVWMELTERFIEALKSHTIESLKNKTD